MTEPDLREWEAALRPLIPTQGLAWGAEAFVITHPCTPIETLRNLSILCFGSNTAPWRPCVDVTRDPDIIERGQYREPHEQTLAHVGQTHALGQPCIAFLWGNSD